MNKFTPYNTSPVKVTRSLGKVVLIFPYRIPMPGTLFAILLTVLPHLEDIVYILKQKSVFHFPAMYTLLQIHFYPHKARFLSVDYLPHSSIHVRSNVHASALNPDVSNLQFLNQLVQSISKYNYKKQGLF